MIIRFISLKRLAIAALSCFPLCAFPAQDSRQAPPAQTREKPPEYPLEPWSSRSATAVILHAECDTETFTPRVVFYLDGAVAGACDTNPFYLSLDLMSLDPGTHRFHAEAYRCGSRIAVSPEAFFHIGPVRILPPRATVAAGGDFQFRLVDMDGLPTEGDWSVEGGIYPGTISKTGLYTAPPEAGSFQVVAGNPFDAKSQAVAQVGADPLNYMTHTAGGERFLLDWMDRNRIGYDLMPDHRLGAMGLEQMLRRYRLLVIQVHPEYLNGAETELIRRYLERGGNILILAGNTLFCRVELQGSPERMARLVRRTEIRQVQALIGEYYRGWSKFMNDYLITRPEHWAFQGLGASAGSHLARGGPWGGGNGWEMDTPGPFSPPGMEQLARGDRSIRNVPTPSIVAYTSPGGGILVNVGSIVFTSTLQSDPMAAGFVRNVLARCGVDVPASGN
jgi:hypothetical protein